MTGTKTNSNRTFEYISSEEKSSFTKASSTCTAGTAEVSINDLTPNLETQFRKLCGQCPRSSQETSEVVEEPTLGSDMNCVEESVSSLSVSSIESQPCYWFEQLWNLLTKRSIPVTRFDTILTKVISYLHHSGKVQGVESAVKILATNELRHTLAETDIFRKQKRLSVFLKTFQTILKNLSTFNSGNRIADCRENQELLAWFRCPFPDRNRGTISSDKSPQSKIWDPVTDLYGKPSVEQSSHNFTSDQESEIPILDSNRPITSLASTVPDSVECLVVSKERAPLFSNSEVNSNILPSPQFCPNTSSFVKMNSSLSPTKLKAPCKRLCGGNSTTLRYSSLTAPDLDDTIDATMNLSLCCSFDEPLTDFQPSVPLNWHDADRYDWTQRENRMMFLSIPETPDELSQRMIPPKVSQPAYENENISLTRGTGPMATRNERESDMIQSEDTERVASYLIDLKDSSTRSVSASPLPQESNSPAAKRGSESSKAYPPSSVVVLTSAVLLTSGGRQCLVVPTDNEKSEAIVNLTEEDMEILFRHGAVVPLKSPTPEQNEISATKKQKTAKSAASAKGTQPSYRLTTAQHPGQRSVHASSETHSSQNGARSVGLEPAMKQVVGVEHPMNCTLPSADLADISSQAKFTSLNSSRVRHCKTQSCGTRSEKRQYIECVLRRLQSNEQPFCNFFQISGYVETELWNRLPAVIEITSFENAHDVLQRFSKDKLTDLRLDKTRACEKEVKIVFQLFEFNLALISRLPDFVLAVVPVQESFECYDLKVFVRFDTDKNVSFEPRFIL